MDSRSVSERMGGTAEKYPYEKFSANWARFAGVILQAVPNARFCGPGVHNNPVWNRRFITDTGCTKHVELITAHLYPGGAGGKVATPESGRDRMLSDEFTTVYKGLHDGFVPMALSNSLPYRLEEANNFYNAGATNVSNTFTASLWGMDFLWWWASHNAAGVNFHTGDRVAAGNRVVPCRYAAFYTTTDGVLAQPLSYAIKTFGLERLHLLSSVFGV